MDTKITLSFEENVITAAKRYADNNNISLSRLTEYLFKKITESSYLQIDELPLADWVHQVAEGEAQYRKSSTRKALKEEYFKSKK